MNAAAQLQEEVCPNCGDFVSQLLPATGWCFKCSQAFILGDGKEVTICINCGAAMSDETHARCWRCREEGWLHDNANHIERYMAQGFSFAVSRDLARIHHGKTKKCLRCGEAMKKASRGTNYFCTQKKECRSAQRKLKWLMYNHRVPRDEALKQVLNSFETA